MAITKNSVVKEVTTLPLEGNIQVGWLNTVEEDGEVLSSKMHYRLFGQDQSAEFAAEVEGAASYMTAMGWV